MLRSRFQAIGAAAAVAVLLFVSGLLVVLAPLPLVAVALLRDRRSGLWAALLAAGTILAVYLLAFPPLATRAAEGVAFVPLPWLGLSGFVPTVALQVMGVGYYGFFLAIAWMLVDGAVHRRKLVLLGGRALAAGLAVVAAVALLLWSTGLAGAVGAGMRDYFVFLLGEVAKAGAAAGEGAALFAEESGSFAAFFLHIAPAAIFVFALIVVVLNLMIGRRLLRRSRAFHHLRNVARFRLPDEVIWAVIGAGGIFFADRYLFGNGAAGVLAVNALIALGALYFFQGLAVVAYFLQGMRMPMMRILAYGAIIFFFQTMSLVIVGIGVADVWANFRLRRWRARHHQA